MPANVEIGETGSGSAGWLRRPEDSRLRAGWRILAFLGIFYGLALPVLFGLRAVLEFPKSSPWVVVIIALTATPAVYLARRFIDRKDVVSLGLKVDRRAVADVLFGFMLSGLMMAAIFSAMVALGYVDNVRVAFTGLDLVRMLTSSLLVMALVGFWEELVFRGYVLQNMAEGLGMQKAILISCLLYGLLHAMNPNAGLLSTAIIVLFGYLRIYGYLATGQLWLSIGMHTGWNFFQADVFGFAASGHTEAQTLLTHEPAAGSWLSGGSFGPEASILTVPVVLLALVCMKVWARRSRPV